MTERTVSPELILDVAARLFAERTYLGANLQDVANELGVTRQALYYHFPKKHDILRAVFDRLFRELNASADAALAVSDDGHSFENLLRGHVEFLASHPDLARLSVQEHRHLPQEMATLVLAKRNDYLNRFYGAYQAGVDAGTLSPIDPRVAVQLSMGAANWLHRWYRPTGDLAPQGIADLAIHTLLSGLAAPADPPRRRAGARALSPSSSRR